MKNNFRIAINESNVDDILEGLYLRGYKWHSGRQSGGMAPLSRPITPNSCLCVSKSNTFGHSGEHSDTEMDLELLKLSDIPLEIKHDVTITKDSPTQIVIMLNGIQVKIELLTNEVKLLGKTIQYGPVTNIAWALMRYKSGQIHIDLKDSKVVEFLKLTNCI